MKLKDCSTCENPTPLPENHLVFQMYQFDPVTPIPMTSGLVLLNLEAVQFLMDVYGVEEDERELLLRKLAAYHDVVYGKETVPNEKTGTQENGG